MIFMKVVYLGILQFTPESPQPPTVQNFRMASIALKSMVLEIGKLVTFNLLKSALHT